MASKASPIPEGYHSVTPYLVIRGGAEAMTFYRKAFNATEVMRMEGPNGTIGHAEIAIGDSRVMLSDECPEMGARSPQALGGSPVTIHLYVEDVDAVAAQAVTAGAKLVHPAQDQFWGDRSATVEDPFGHVWHLATHQEDIPLDEIRRRAAACMQQHQPAG